MYSVEGSAEKTKGRAILPPLKWAGGKRWLIPRLIELYAPHRAHRLVEPFCGGLAVALGLAPQRALLNDLNPHAVNFYRCLQNGLVSRIRMSNQREAYLRARHRFNALVRKGAEQSEEAAVLFYYLNRTCYNGLCRFNRRGEFNVPFGRYRAIRYVRDFKAYQAVLSAWKFSLGDFEEIRRRSSDFIYADPPYDVEFRSYSKEGFSWEDQQRLALWLSKHQGPVVASNQATTRILELYGRLGFKIERLLAPRRISCDGSRAPAWEMLAYKNIDGRVLLRGTAHSGSKG